MYYCTNIEVPHAIFSLTVHILQNLNLLKQLFDEVRATRLDVHKLREEQRISSSVLRKLQEDTLSLSQQLKEMREKTFTVQGSEFQVGITSPPETCS